MSDGVWCLIAMGYSNGGLRIVNAGKGGEFVGYDGCWRVNGTKVYVVMNSYP